MKGIIRESLSYYIHPSCARSITDGSGITGKVRIRLQVRYPTAIANKLNDTVVHAAIEERHRQSSQQVQGEAVRKQSITVSHESTAVVVKPRVMITTLPFLLTVTSITAVDLKPRHTFVANSPYVNGVFGSWGQVSPSISMLPRVLPFSV